MAIVSNFGPQEQAMQGYFREGEARAMMLGNRGPIRFTDEGRLHPDILAAYNRVGFYVFENVLGAVELSELRAEFHEMVERLPSTPDSPLDSKGRPALGAGEDSPVAMWAKPLGDPLGGTEIANGRHAVKMFEPRAGARLARTGAVHHSRTAAIFRGGLAPVRPSAAAADRRDDLWQRLRPLYRGGDHQEAGRGGEFFLAPGRHHALAGRRLGSRHPRLQFHGATLWLDCGQRRLVSARHACDRHGSI